MSLSPNIQPLREVDEFHKNAALMFEDIHASIQQRALGGTIIPWTGPEGAYGVWNSRDSEHKRLFVFAYADKYRFVQMLIKIHDEKLRGKGRKYKAVCEQLQIDPVVPLIMVWGVLQPRDVARFNRDQNVRRNWADNTLLLGVPDEINLAEPSSYSWGATITVGSTDGTDSYYCEGAAVQFKPLTDIRDTRDIAFLTADLMAM
jgi:hypothetical protein